MYNNNKFINKMYMQKKIDMTLVSNLIFVSNYNLEEPYHFFTIKREQSNSGNGTTMRKL